MLSSRFNSWRPSSLLSKCLHAFICWHPELFTKTRFKGLVGHVVTIGEHNSEPFVMKDFEEPQTQLYCRAHNTVCKFEQMGLNKRVEIPPGLESRFQIRNGVKDGSYWLHVRTKSWTSCVFNIQPKFGSKINDGSAPTKTFTIRTHRRVCSLDHRCTSQDVSLRIPPRRKLLLTFTWKRVYYCFNRANTLMFGMIEQVRTTGPVTTCDVYKWIRHSPVSQSLGKKSRLNFAIAQLSESLIPRDKAPTGSSAVISFPNHGK